MHLNILLVILIATCIQSIRIVSALASNHWKCFFFVYHACYYRIIFKKKVDNLHMTGQRAAQTALYKAVSTYVTQLNKSDQNVYKNISLYQIAPNWALRPRCHMVKCFLRDRRLPRRRQRHQQNTQTLNSL